MGVLPSVRLAKIALLLVEVHIRGYWPRHEQTKQNTIIDLLRQRFGEYNFAYKFSQTSFIYIKNPQTETIKSDIYIEVGIPPKIKSMVVMLSLSQ